MSTPTPTLVTLLVPNVTKRCSYPTLPENAVKVVLTLLVMLVLTTLINVLKLRVLVEMELSLCFNGGRSFHRQPPQVLMLL
jgi:hypothetical protein